MMTCLRLKLTKYDDAKALLQRAYPERDPGVVPEHVWEFRTEPPAQFRDI